MSALLSFNPFYDQFKKSDCWTSMLNTRENSPWHREENVAYHTRMTIDWYKKTLLKNRNETQQLLTLFLCLFHDVGKPKSMVKKSNKEIGDFLSFAGHSKHSSVIWKEFAVNNAEMLNSTFKFSDSDIQKISLFIEHHDPFKISDLEKQIVKDKTNHAEQRAWLDFILADHYGRIQDDPLEDIIETEKWVDKWKF